MSRNKTVTILTTQGVFMKKILAICLMTMVASVFAAEQVSSSGICQRLLSKNLKSVASFTKSSSPKAKVAVRN